MTVAGYVLAGIAALLHVFIFYLESIAWESPRARKVFGTTAEEAQTTKFLAFNQGFYNLFLAIVVGIGIVFAASGEKVIGATLTLTGVGSMFAAAVVLFVASAAHRPAAIRQGTFPLLALAVLIIGLSL
ncbi:DUF1304 domain-containing protein [Jongsikchunia kroppenstedtii]|uniref:DUF1304 domain-containing protein n=1 Tax=Jongsikchunia kroppenstedtii TaxID=1121721 RepID=UPI0003791C5C|nr:DUF1304 domain-containing protein [Jongsikchunia kroppenstedtii]